MLAAGTCSVRCFTVPVSATTGLPLCLREEWDTLFEGATSGHFDVILTPACHSFCAQTALYLP